MSLQYDKIDKLSCPNKYRTAAILLGKRVGSVLLQTRAGFTKKKAIAILSQFTPLKLSDTAMTNDIATRTVNVHGSFGNIVSPSTG